MNKNGGEKRQLGPNLVVVAPALDRIEDDELAKQLGVDLLAHLLHQAARVTAQNDRKLCE